MAGLNLDLGLPSMDPQQWREFGVKTANEAVWADSPRRQVVVNVVIVAGLMLSTVGFTVGLPLALASLGLLGVGVARLAYGAVAGRVG